MRRREFITLLGSTAATWPLAVRAQQSERIRRIGVLMNRPADDVVGAAMVSTFKQSLQQLGWRDGHNIRMDVRWGANDPESERRYAVELNALAPDVTLARRILKKAERGETYHEHQSCPVAAGLHHRRPSFPHQRYRHHGASGVVQLDWETNGRWRRCPYFPLAC
jgi:hypothetical protein